ncbi:MAG TPA: dihydrofolate reductase [Candidatus Pacearchaeota archaeon]|nr:dihydrofolate reductase [Candidatus Pacearchaeota archaeon]
MIELKIIAALAENNVIGYQGKMPWGKIKEDLEHFRSLTIPHPVIMGRKTYESIGKPLAERENIVISLNPQLIKSPSGIYLCNNLEQAISHAEELDSVAFIIGGQKLYEQTINHPLTSTLEITRIYRNYFGDAFFPWININEWELSQYVCGKECDFETYARRS